MHHLYTKHTIDIFARMEQNLPPLVPAEVKVEIARALEHLNHDYMVSSTEVDNMVIALGKKVWPYWKAFNEFFARHTGNLGEKFLLGKLSSALKQRYHEYKEHGATYHDLRMGGPLMFFTGEEREILVPFFIEVDQEIRAHAEQAVLTGERRQYEELIVNFQNILDDIEKRLVSLRQVAEDEEEHPGLAEEIRGQVKAFEFGMCLLGPNTQAHEVLNADDYFVERKQDKKINRFE